jgi:hypothetical protein
LPELPILEEDRYKGDQKQCQRDQHLAALFLLGTGIV